MKAIKKTLAILLASMMVLAMSVTVFAASQVVTYTGADKTTDAKITISNAVEGRKYHLYRIFPMTLNDANEPAYTLPAGKTDLVAGGIDGAQWFELKNGYISAKTELTEDVLKSDNFKTWALAYAGEEVISATASTNGASTATANNELTFENIPYGYYIITVDPSSSDNTTDPSKGDYFRGVVTVDSTMPTATVEDKNAKPSWDDEYGKEIKNSTDPDTKKARIEGSFGIGENVEYEIAINTRNRDQGDGTAADPAGNIFRYTVIDSIASGMTYNNDLKVVVGDVNTSNHTVLTVEPIANYDGNPYSTAHQGKAYITYFTVPYAQVREYMNNNNLTNLADLPANMKTTNVAEAQSFRIDVPWAAYTLDGSGKAIVDDGANFYNDGMQLVLTYTAFLDANKVTSANFNNPNDNVAEFLFYKGGDNPDDFEPRDPTEVAPKQETNVYVTELLVKKTDANGNALTGAEFTLTGPDGKILRTVTETFVDFVDAGSGRDADGLLPTDAAYKYWKLASGKYTENNPDEMDGTNYKWDRTKYATDASGAFIKAKMVVVETTGNTATGTTSITKAVNDAGQALFQGLAQGSYTLSETVVPDGYNKIDDITFDVTFNYNNKTDYSFSGTNNVTWNAATKTLEITVVNESGVELPQTGGVGTILFYVVGAILLIGAGVVLFARRRVSFVAE